MIVYEPAQDIADWVAARVGAEAPLVDAAIGFEQDGQLRAAVYFDVAHENNIFAHIASDAVHVPVSLMRAVAAYVYDQLGLTRMTFAVSEANTRACKFVRAMGAQLEARLRDACGDSDLLLFVLWRDTPFARRIMARST